jgi:F-type H+-transporting ATPase subunit delta
MLENRRFQEGRGLGTHRLLARPFLLKGCGLGGGAPQPSGTRKFLEIATEEPVLAGVAGRYGSALFDLAAEEKRISEVERDLSTFQTLYSESLDLVRMVRSPVIPADEQSRALSALLGRAGLGELTLNFFKLITRNRRLFAVPDMIRAFRALAAKARGEVAAEVTSAVPLSEAQLAMLKETLKASVGKEVALSTRVDPALLGGLVVKLGSRMVDSSLRTKLAGLKLSLKGGL